MHHLLDCDLVCVCLCLHIPHHLLWTPGDPLLELMKKDISMDGHILLIHTVSLPFPTASQLLQDHHTKSSQSVSQSDILNELEKSSAKQ